MPSTDTLNVDLDQGGTAFQKVAVYLGPSLGWVYTYVKPTQLITTAGTFTLDGGTSVVFINVAGSVTLNLPSVRTWSQQASYMPATGLERAIWIKDLGGHAAASPITVAPNGTDKIDLLAQSFSIVQNRQLLRLYPLNDLTGWYSG